MDTPIAGFNQTRISETLRPQLARLSKTMMVYGVGGFLNRFIGFLLLPVFTAYLTPVDYGISSILSWVAFVLTPIFSLGMGAAIAPCYFEGNNPKRKEITVRTAFSLLLISSGLLAIMGVVLARPISSLAFKTSEYHDLVALSLLSTSLSILSIPSTLYLQLEERAKLFVTLTLLVTVGSVASSLLLVVTFGRGIRGWVEAGLIGQAINVILFLLPTIRKVGFRFCFTLSKELLKLSAPLIPSFAFVFILQHGNRYIIQWFDGLESLGVYTVGFNLGLAMSLAVSAFQTSWLPFFMSFVEKREEARLLFGRILTYYVFAFGAVTILFFIGAKPIVMLLTQPAFHEAYKVVGLSASAQFLAGLFYVLLPGLYFAKEVGYVGLVQALASMVALGLNLILVPLCGLLGAAISLALGFLGMVLLTLLWNFKRRAKYLEVQYEWRRVIGFALLYSGYAAIMLLERNLSWIGEVVYSLIVMMTLPLVLLSLLKPNERRTVMALPSFLYRRSVISAE